MWRLVGLLISTLLAGSVSAHISGLPIHVTGGAVDAGENCAQCHKGTPVNAGGGRFFLNVSNYAPGVTQTITVTIQDPVMQRFGFQLTARLVTDTTQPAGSFSPTSDSQIFCDPNANPGPCYGAPEYITHTPASALPSSVGTRTYVLTWTPPGRDAGDVIFYAAGLAANGDGLAGGDHVYASSLRMSSAGCNLAGPAAILGSGGLGDAASYRTTISPGGLISVFGSGFNQPGAGSYAATHHDLVNGEWPTDLACVGLLINGIRAPVFFTSGNQINAQTPGLNATGPLNAQVILNPDTPNPKLSNVVAVQVAAVAAGLFTFNRQGTRSIAALNASQGNQYLADPADVPAGIHVVSARPGDVVSVFGAGFGSTNPPYAAGAFATGPAPLSTPPVVQVGGVTLQPADLVYAGLSPEAPGLYRFDLRVPVLPAGNAPVLITVGASRTQTQATIPVQP